MPGRKINRVYQLAVFPTRETGLHMAFLAGGRATLSNDSSPASLCDAAGTCLIGSNSRQDRHHLAARRTGAAADRDSDGIAPSASQRRCAWVEERPLRICLASS